MIRDSRQRLFEMMNRVSGMPLREEKISKLPPGFQTSDFISLEQDIEQTPCETGIEEDIRDFKGLGATEISPEDLKKSAREKFKGQLGKTKQGLGPEGRFHASTYRRGMDLSNIKDVKGIKIDPKQIGKKKFHVDLENIPDIDLEVIKKIILTPPPPDKLLGQNTKMKHSDFYSISMPALKSFVFNLSDQKWYVIKICRKAGECENWCYAQMGQYVINEEPIRHRSQMLNYLINHWEEWREKVISRIKTLAAKSKNEEFVVRWHDTGDFMSPKYLEIAIDIAKATPDVIHYVYTKEVSMVRRTEFPSNFEIKFSFGGLEDKNINPDDPRAYVVPSEIFDKLHPKMPIGADKKEWDEGGKWRFSDDAWKTIKSGISKFIKKKYKHNVPTERILTHDEYMGISHNRTLPQERKWFVIEKPGDTDIPASRKDVMAIINLEHK